MVATGATIRETSKIAKKLKAKEIYAFCTHVLFPLNFQKRSRKSILKKTFIYRYNPSEIKK